MTTTTKSLSANPVAKRYDTQAKTDRLFMQKIREAIQPSQQYLINDQLHVDDFVVGGKELE